MKLVIIIRSLLAAVGTVITVLIFSTMIVASTLVFRRMSWADRLVQIWGRINLFMYNIKVEISGEENLPENGCLFLFNHSSHFDIIVLTATMNKIARFGAKVELFKIPFFGHALKALGSLPIIRSDREKVFKLYDESIGRVHRGESFYLAAEGTRQPTPGVGRLFKSGPFIFAISGQFPVIPIVIKGAAECLPKGRLIACVDKWRYQVHIKILPPISTQGLTVQNRQVLMDQTRVKMTEAYAQLGHGV